MKFNRSARNQADDRGRIRVQVVRLDDRAGRQTYAMRGNIIRSVTIPDARVSEVIEAIEVALFEKDQ